MRYASWVTVLFAWMAGIAISDSHWAYIPVCGVYFFVEKLLVVSGLI